MLHVVGRIIPGHAITSRDDGKKNRIRKGLININLSGNQIFSSRDLILRVIVTRSRLSLRTRKVRPPDEQVETDRLRIMRSWRNYPDNETSRRGVLDTKFHGRYEKCTRVGMRRYPLTGRIGKRSVILINDNIYLVIVSYNTHIP